MKRFAFGADEWRGGLQATAAMLPFTLSYGFIAFGMLGAAATQAGLAASVFSVVVGGVLLALLSRAALPSASPTASCCLVLAAAVAVWLRDPMLQPGSAGGLMLLWALVGITVLAAGLLQTLMGLLGVGSLARYVPQPVLAGFANGVAVLIAVSQLAPALGLSVAQLQRDGVAALAAWQPAALAVVVGTAALVAVVGRLAPRWPAYLVALVLAIAAVWAIDLAVGAPAPGAGLGVAMVGPLQATVPLPTALAPLLGEAGFALLERHAGVVLSTALLLALLGSLETVLNLAAIDQRMQTRSDPNRMLAAVGLVNMALGLFGALPVAYMRLRALAALNDGGRTAGAVVIGSVLLAAVFLIGLPLIERCPKPVVAGVLLMLAWSLVDPWSLALLRGRDGAVEAGSVTDRRLSLVVVAVVCGVTVIWGFVAGVALGVLLSFVVLLRALNRSLVRLHYTAAAIPSRRVYGPVQEQALAGARAGIQVLELEGALFFGNVDRLELEVETRVRASAAGPPPTSLVLDLRRVSTVDASGAVMLGRLQDLLAPRGVTLRLAGVTADNRHGAALRAHGMLGAAGAPTPARPPWSLHEDADRAIEASERALLAAAGLPPVGTPVPLAQCQLFAGLDAADFEFVRSRMPERELGTGERVFAQGDAGDALYVLSAGSVSILDSSRQQRFFSYSPGMTFGELAVLDGGGRSADAVADEPSRVCVLPAAAMQALESEAPAIAARLYRNLALTLAVRLRDATAAWRRAAG